ncbi:MAG TPA: glutamyl-tRNA reductase [Leucothrix mucor]|nr:glutamyl-tRNA reductase [Leucothrix mucor]
MSIVVIGVNHKTAPVSLREQLAFSPEKLIDALTQANKISAEGMILSTCNRTEIYFTTDNNSQIKAIINWLAEYHQLSEDTLSPYLYIHTEEDAVRHTFRVACGLDSLVLGEPQILGQLKIALKTASDNKSTGRTLKRLMQFAFSTAKKVRTQTSIGSNPVSVAFAAVNLAKQIFSNLEEQTVLLIGAGETIELVGRHIHSTGVKKIIIANRSIDNAAKLAKQFDGQCIGLAEIVNYLPDADIVISSTAAPLPIIGKGTVEKALKARKHRPIFMVDIAVPRDIEEAVGELDDIYLYTVDDLHSVIEENLKSRQQAAEKAEVMVTEEVKNFSEWLQAQDQVKLIQSYRTKTNDIKQETLDKAQKMLANGKTADEALQFLAHTLTNKLAHAPTAAMNKAAHSGNIKLLQSATKLLGLTKS